MFELKKTNELNINDFIKLAEDNVGLIGDLEFETQSRQGEIAGTFEILGFEKSENPKFTYTVHWLEDDETPNGADLGVYTIKLTNTKFYNGKTFRFKVTAYVQDEDRGTNEMLHISTLNEDTGKYLKAYCFPILNWIPREK